MGRDWLTRETTPMTTWLLIALFLALWLAIAFGIKKRNGNWAAGVVIGFIAATVIVFILGSASSRDTSQPRGSLRSEATADSSPPARTEIIGAWSCFDQVNMTFERDGTGSLVTLGLPNASTPLHRSTSIERFTYTLDGSQLQLAFTEIDLTFAPQDTATRDALVTSGVASALPDGSIKLEKPHQAGLRGVLLSGPPYLKVHWTTLVKPDGSDEPANVTATCAESNG